LLLNNEQILNEGYTATMGSLALLYYIQRRVCPSYKLKKTHSTCCYSPVTIKNRYDYWKSSP